MNTQAAVYALHNSRQYSDAEKLLNECSFHWPEKACVMDAGCGTGNVTKQLISNMSPNITEVVGVDILPGMIKHAEKNFGGPNISYHVADLQDSEIFFAKSWGSKFDKIFSLTALHWVPDHKKVLANLHYCSKPNAEIILYFQFDFPGWNRAFNSVMNSNCKWKQYLSEFRTTHICIDNIGERHRQTWLQTPDPLIEYKSMVEQFGFKISEARCISPDSYRLSYEELMNVLSGCLPQLEMIPPNLHDQFVHDFIGAWDPDVDVETGKLNPLLKYAFIRAIKSTSRVA